MFQIGEFSKITKVSLRMLRYYDKNDILKPEKKDEWTGYRYYTSKQIDELYRIVRLRDSGFGVSQIKEYLGLKEKEQKKKILEEKRAEIERELEQAGFCLSQLKALQADLLEENDTQMPEVDIVMKSIPKMDVISMRRTVPDYYAEGELWVEMTKLLTSVGYADDCEGFSMYYEEDEEEGVDIELCVVRDARKEIPRGLVHRQVEAVERAASIIVHGSFDNIDIAYRRFGFWMEKHPEYEMCGPTRQICHAIAGQQVENGQFVIELLVPLKLKGTV